MRRTKENDESCYNSGKSPATNLNQRNIKNFFDILDLILFRATMLGLTAFGAYQLFKQH